MATFSPFRRRMLPVRYLQNGIIHQLSSPQSAKKRWTGILFAMRKNKKTCFRFDGLKSFDIAIYVILTLALHCERTQNVCQ